MWLGEFRPAPIVSRHAGRFPISQAEFAHSQPTNFFMSTSEVFLIAMLIIFTAPYLIWRLARTDYFAPLVVVQIIAGILLGPGVLGALFPDYYKFVFNPNVILSLNAIAQWAVMLFVWIAGIELDLRKAWQHRRESGTTAGLALGVPLLFGAAAAMGMLMFPGWIGAQALRWQFVLGIGMACAVTALPILILFMEKLQILRQPIGQRILRYASLDDIAIWGVLALILMDWQRVGKQLAFLALFALASFAFRRLMLRIPERDRWYAGLIWLTACGLGADWSGLHYMVGAFIAGAVMDSDWFDQKQMDWLRHHVLLVVMPVFFLSTGLRTNWQVGGAAVFIAAALLLVASVAGKLIGTRLAGRLLGWQPGEASLIGWLLQTKALIMIIFANVLLDKAIITSEAFTALLLMAVGSTMLTVPVVAPKLQRMREIIFRSK
jgi:Kef-type K+ transport system membrane component KefB